MAGGMVMLRRMLILRGIAATHMPATEAQSQVYPRITGFQTVLATSGLWRHSSNLIQVGALLSHDCPVSTQSDKVGVTIKG